MKILVLSDSHNIIYELDKIIESLKNNVKAIIHLGDCSTDISKYPMKYPDIEFYKVNGNCDFNRSAPIEDLITIGEKKFFLTHGHYYNVKYSYDELTQACIEREADICLFGHTHLPTLFVKEDIYFMNPGSISFPRGIQCPSYGIIDIENGKINMSVVGIFKDFNKVILDL